MATLAQQLEALPVLDSLQREENPLVGSWVKPAAANNIGKATATGWVTTTAAQECQARWNGGIFSGACAIGLTIAVLPTSGKGWEFNFCNEAETKTLLIEITRTAAEKCTVRIEINGSLKSTTENVTLAAGDTFYISLTPWETNSLKVWRKASAGTPTEIAAVEAGVVEAATLEHVRLHAWDTTATTYRLTNFRGGALFPHNVRTLLGVGA